MDAPINREDAKEAIKEMAMRGLSSAAIGRALKKKGLDGIVDRFEVEQWVTEARAIASLLPPRPSKTVPRILGLVAILFGVGGLAIGDGSSAGGRYSPSGYAITAIILGVILILKPAWSKEEI